MSRYTTDTFVTASVPATSSLDIERTILSNLIDITKIKIVPSDGTNTNIFTIHKKAARAIGDLLYVSAAFTGVLYCDPVDSSGNELNEGSVVPYYDGDESLLLHLRIHNNHSSAKTYTITIEYESLVTDAPGVLGTPDGGFALDIPQDLTVLSDGCFVLAIPTGLTILAGVGAKNYMEGVDQSEIRAHLVTAGGYSTRYDLRTVAEGGTWVPNGTTDLLLSGVATSAGSQFTWVSPSQGRWYIVGRLRNAIGWSLWSDGNATPSNVIQFVDTTASADIGPAADWEVVCEQGPVPQTVIVRCSRPRTNSNSLMWWYVQVKDASVGSWRTLDANAGAAVTKYDGSAVAHSYSPTTGLLTKAGSGWGTAGVGDLICVDVRGGNFDINHCLLYIVGEGDLGSNTLHIGPYLRSAVTTNLRVKIVNPYWSWDTEGYLGASPNSGFWPDKGPESSANNGMGLGWISGDYSTKEFVTTPIPIPAGISVSNIEARVLFQNMYSMSDNSLTHSIRGSDQLGGPGYIGPGVYKNLNDRALWIPVYPSSNYGSLVFNGDGSVTMAISGTSESLHSGVVGVRGRFRIHPNSSQVLSIRAKFEDITLPVGLGADDRLGLGINFYDGFTAYGQLWPMGVMIIGSNSKVKFGSGSNPGMGYLSTSPTNLGDMFAHNAYNAYNATISDRPIPGSILEIIANFDLSTYNGQFADKDLWYRLGGSGGWAGSNYGFLGRLGSIGMRGGEIFIGWVGNCRLNGATAKLTEVEIISGFGEVI